MSTPTPAPQVPDALFYHLERQTLDDVLPLLLEKTLERGWKAVVQTSDAESLASLDASLWTYSEQSFLAHGTQKDGHSEWQPVYLTAGEENPNGASVRFYVNGSEAKEVGQYQRLVFIFDGRVAARVESARQQWKTLRAEGCNVTYWQQDAAGRWVRKG